MSSELALYGEETGVVIVRKPADVLAEAQDAAKALISVIEQKKNKVMFNGEQYIEREDWGTVAKFYGCTAKVIETRYVQFGEARGFEAVAVCIDRDQREISRAESMCLSDEDNWGAVPVYEWKDVLDADGKKIWEDKGGKKRPKSEKVLVGTKPKPLFQLRSMAQTRAEAKVLKSVFGYVVVLAGYRPSVAEEMTGNEAPRDDADREPTQQRQPVQQPQRESAKAAEPPKDSKQFTVTVEDSKMGNGGEVQWLKTTEGLIALNKKDIHNPSIVRGVVIAVTAKEYVNDQIGKHWIASSVNIVEVPVEEGEAIEAEKATAQDKASPEAIDNLFDSGKVTTAASIEPNPQEGGVIGVSRAQRIHALITQQHKRTGYTEKHLKMMLDEMGLEHLRDLPKASHSFIEKCATGEDVSWKEEVRYKDL